MGGSTTIEGVDDRANMIETQKTFAFLGNFLRISTLCVCVYIYSEMSRGGLFLKC